MASKPGILTDWPWQKLGNFKYIALVPLMAHSIHAYFTKPEGEKDLSNFIIFPVMIFRLIHAQIWISLNRFQTSRSTKKIIIEKSIEFEQVDRESNWDDSLILSALMLYFQNLLSPEARHLPNWRGDGALLIILFHMGAVEFLYYWFHRALHHHYLYSRYHSHHHSSIAIEPITSVVHPFVEVLMYHFLFFIPALVAMYTGTASLVAIYSYVFYIDLMNNLGHCNFEVVPKWLFYAFPPLKYLMYTPSFHSLHHTKFRANYCLFMPMYDYLYGTTDNYSDTLYEKSLERGNESPNVVYLSHFTSLQSIYHERVGIGALSSKPYSSKWYMWAMTPLTFLAVVLAWVFGSTFTGESNKLEKLKMQTWVVPRFSFQYQLQFNRSDLNKFIEKAILDADKGGVKVISLGLQNQGEELNYNGLLYNKKYPHLKVRIVDGTALAVAIVLRTIPKDTKHIILGGDFSKAGYAIVRELCEIGLKVSMTRKETLHKMKTKLPESMHNQLSDLFGSPTTHVWLVANGITKDEQKTASKGTHFITISSLPPDQIRNDCTYYPPPSMIVPSSMENIHSCENWLPRRVMSAPRISGILHSIEGWEEHETGYEFLEINRTWKAATIHGFHHYYAASSSIMD